MNRLLTTIIGAALFSTTIATTGCVARGTMHSSATVYSEPNLVWVDSGVWVVEDYPEPVFYTDGYYWRSSGNVWYRSSIHTGGWARVEGPRVPRVVVTVKQPRMYVHYHAKANARVKRGPQQRAQPKARDHRGERDHRKAPKQQKHKDKHKDKHKNKGHR